VRIVSTARLIFGAFLIVLIVLAELVFEALHVPAWPAFMIMIFFFVEHMNVKKAGEILVGGFFGIGTIFLAAPTIGLFGPLVGAEIARLIFIVGIVYAIVVLGEAIPLVFNNYAFMFLTVSALAITSANPNPFVWMAVEALGGGALLVGIVGIGKLMAAIAPASSDAPAGAEGAH